MQASPLVTYLIETDSHDDWGVLIGIQDISKRSTLPKVLARVEEKFRLDLNGKALPHALYTSMNNNEFYVYGLVSSDEQAEQFFVSMVNETLHALAPRVMDELHKVAVSWR